MRPILKGSTDQSVVIRIIDSTAGTPEEAVEHDTSGIALWYRREGATKTAITPASLASLDAAHSDGGIEHIDDGYYRLDVADAAFASSAGINGVMIGGTVTGMIVIGCYVPLVSYDPYDSVRLGLTALPNAAADAAGGLPISDAGGLDLDVKLANTNEVTAARMGALTDLIDGGRLDLLIDAVLEDTGTTLPGTLTTIAGYLDTEIAAILADTNELQLDITNGGRIDLLIDAIKAKTDSLTFTVAGDVDCNVQAWKGAAAQEMTGDAFARLGAPAGASVSADVAAIKSDTAAILVDTGTTLQSELDGIQADTEDLQAQIGVAGAALTAVPWNAAWDSEVQSECTDALNAYDPPTKAELDTAVANVSVDEIQATAIADLFNTDSGTNYAAAVAGSAVKEIADNAGGSALTEGGIADAVWDELIAGHAGVGTAGKILGDNINAPIATIDAVVDAIKAKTDNLPADPADQSAVEAAVTAATSPLATSVNLATVAGYLDTEIAAILADTNELQTNQGAWATAVGFSTHSAGDVKTAIEAGGGSIALIKAVTDALTSAAAAKLAISAGTMVAGTVSHDNTIATTTVFYSDDITEATADHFNGRIVIFTSGALQYQATSISDYELSAGEGKFTVVALTEAPADNVTFIIV